VVPAVGRIGDATTLSGGICESMVVAVNRRRGGWKLAGEEEGLVLLRAATIETSESKKQECGPRDSWRERDGVEVED
jgi:hypothetical protein